MSVEGATVGEYKTCVQAANLLSIALGGDSHITFTRDQQIAVGPERVLPLAHLAADHPEVGKRLKALARRQWAQATPDWLEYWYLLREPPPGLLETPREEALVALLRDGPQPVPEILKHLKVLHIGQVEAKELLRQEIIGKAGLTPTDLMHVEGTYGSWDAEAAAVALEVFAHNRWREPAEVRAADLAPGQRDGVARHRDVPLRQAAGCRRALRTRNATTASGPGSSTTACTMTIRT